MFVRKRKIPDVVGQRKYNHEQKKKCETKKERQKIKQKIVGRIPEASRSVGTASYLQP